MPHDSPPPATPVASFDPDRIAAARERLSAQGLSTGQWAKRNGYSPVLVRHVLGGRKPCKTGRTHDIAVKLGLKDGQLVDAVNG